MVRLPEVLKLPFLGERSYLHGTTLFGSMQKYCANGSDLTFKINRLLETDRIELKTYDPTTAAPTDYHATLFWREEDQICGIGVTPLTPSPEPERQPYDESKIIEIASFDGSTATLRTSTPYLWISNVVALNKALLVRKLSPPQPGQWLFTRLDLNRIPMQVLPLEIQFMKNFNYRAVSTDISIASRSIGRIIFSWWAR
jgi:hypothetical protein